MPKEDAGVVCFLAIIGISWCLTRPSSRPGWLRRPKVCHGCGIHSWDPTVLVEPASSFWTERKPGSQIRTSPHTLKFCQDSISRVFYDRSSVFDLRQGTPRILACFHSEHGETRLFALNSRTLFNAIINNINDVLVNIVEKPADWPRRFTASCPWMCVKVRGLHSHGLQAESASLRIPASAFPGQSRQRVCFVVLEVRNLISPSPDTATFYDMLKDMSPDLDVHPYDGQRSFARVGVSEDDVALVRSMAKGIAARMGKNVRVWDCKEVQGLRWYESPRD